MTGRYRLVESIGQGGMGRVWRAADEILDRPVAVKEIRIDGLDGEDTRTRRERTLREARATARIDHPNVVRVYDVVDEGERLWIVMELVRGRSLERILAEDGPLGPRETARTGLGLVAALRQVHARGVLHRDIKPGNVLVDGSLEPDRRIVLTDFGIAAIQDAKALTMVGMLVGSPDYMAPERISGRPQGPPSDIWSLGATLCAALGGRSPFSRGTTLATLHAVLYEEPELPAAAGLLSGVLAALLEKEPEARPGLAELEEALRPVAFPPPTPTLPVGGGGADTPEERPPQGRPTAAGATPAPPVTPSPEPPTPQHGPSGEPPAPTAPHTRLVRAARDPRRPEPPEDVPPTTRQETQKLHHHGHTPPQLPDTAATPTSPSEDRPALAAPSEGPPALTAPADGPPAVAPSWEGPPASAAPSDSPPHPAAPWDGPPASAVPSDSPPHPAAPSDIPPASAAPTNGPPASAPPADGSSAPASRAGDQPAPPRQPDDPPASSPRADAASAPASPVGRPQPAESPVARPQPGESPVARPQPAESPVARPQPGAAPVRPAEPSPAPVRPAEPSPAPVRPAEPAGPPAAPPAPAPVPAASAEVPSELRSEAGAEAPSLNSRTNDPTSHHSAPPGPARTASVSLTRAPAVTRPRPASPDRSLHEQGTRPRLGPHPLHGETSATPARRHRRAGVLAAAALVAAGAAVVVTVLLNSGGQGGDHAGPTTSATRPPTTSGSAPPPTVEGTSRPRTLPPGTHEEAGGYAWATPAGWKRNVMTGAEVHYTSPDGAQELVAKSAIARDDLMRTWRKSEQDAHQGQNYQKIRLEQTTFRGHPAVVWEYTFTLKGVDWHARLLGFDQEGRSYQINTWYHPDIETRAVGVYDRVKDSFTVL
ncbi:protein kinase [Streptomyces sp. NPDC057403]|uniref:serine/threonine-protein kinase n=1 Tax=Streptomyces sp. NPDC057403 TaxID=3346119 RepID=UPI0036CC3681